MDMQSRRENAARAARAAERRHTDPPRLVRWSGLGAATGSRPWNPTGRPMVVGDEPPMLPPQRVQCRVSKALVVLLAIAFAGFFLLGIQFGLMIQ